MKQGFLSTRLILKNQVSTAQIGGVIWTARYLEGRSY